MNILIVTGDGSLSRSLSLQLTSHGETPVVAWESEEALSLAEHYPYDLILLGESLADISGRKMLAKLRRTVKTPVVVLSPDSSVEAKSLMFRSGADDYLVMPFHIDELLARIGAVVRRANGHGSSSILVGKLEVELHEKRAKVDGRILPLTGHEWRCLELLTMRRGNCVTKEALMDALYGLAPSADCPGVKIIDVFVCKLRKKLRDFGVGALISTIWGRGYMLDAAPAAAE